MLRKDALAWGELEFGRTLFLQKTKGRLDVACQGNSCASLNEGQRFV